MDEHIKHLVVIEDDTVYARHLQNKILCDLDPIVFFNIGSALQYFKEQQPDVILLDLKLPDKPWPDSLGEVVAACPEAAVIVITGDANDLDGTKAMELGAQDYFAKDELKADSFRTAIHRAYQRARRFAKIDKALKEAQLAATRSSNTPN